MTKRSLGLAWVIARWLWLLCFPLRNSAARTRRPTGELGAACPDLLPATAVLGILGPACRGLTGPNGACSRRTDEASPQAEVLARQPRCVRYFRQPPRRSRSGTFSPVRRFTRKCR
jgi:hypothetical protein